MNQGSGSSKEACCGLSTGVQYMCTRFLENDEEFFKAAPCQISPPSSTILNNQRTY